MKSCLLYLTILFLSIHSFGQELESYKLDYSSLYTQKNGSGETILKRYIIGNSTDDSYFLYLILTPTDTIFDMALVDTKKNRHYQFNFKRIALNNVKSLEDLSKKYVLHKSDTSKIRDGIRSYDIKHETIEGKDVIVAKVFKNKKRNKLFAGYHYYIKQDSTNTSNFYVASSLISQFFPIREIKAKGILSRVDTFDEKSTILLRDNLVESKPLELILNLKTEPVIMMSSLIIQHK